MPKETVEIKRVIDGVQASMAVEGLKPSKKAQMIGRKYLKGKLTSKEAVTMITAHHVNKRKNK